MIEHSKGLEKIVAKRISQGLRYMETLKSLYGADPREVWEVFRKYKDESCNKIGLINSYSKLPEPHPAYSQWRLTKNSAKMIFGNLARKDYKRICFLGCPVLAMGYKENNAVLLDIDYTLLRYSKLQSRRYDVNDEIPNNLLEKFDCVIADPPWYLEDIKLFTTRSAQLTRKGGTIYISIPRLLTRPFIPEERLNFQKWLTKNNLIIAEIAPSVEYEVPPFEYMAYLDIPAFTGEIWRVGDWLKLKKADDFNCRTKKLKQVNWLEFNFDKKRVFLKEKKEDHKKPRASILNSLIFNSVSKRNPLIPLIDVWSSRNAVLHIDSGYSHVKDMLSSLEKAYSTAGKFDEEKIKDKLSKKLVELILI